MSGRFLKGQSGNPAGRPRQRRPNISAFDIIFDRTLTVTQGGVERELTIDEALEVQTYMAAVKGSKMAVRYVLKMIEKREVVLRKASSAPVEKSKPFRLEYDTDSANEAMLLLNIICRNPEWGERLDGPRPFVVETWAAQAAISRPGRRKLSHGKDDTLNLFVKDFAKIRRPRGRP